MNNQKYVVYALILVGGLALAWLIRGLSGTTTGQANISDRPAESAPFSLKPGQVRIGSLAVTVPGGWKAESPASSMRIGQFRLPAEEGDSEDAELAIFSGIGGGVEGNLQRWFNQFRQPDDIPSSDRARVSTFTVDGMAVTMADVSGTFVDSGMMTAEPEEHSGYRLLAAIVEAPDDFYYFKLVGPEATLLRWAESFSAFVRSIRRMR